MGIGSFFAGLGHVLAGIPAHIHSFDGVIDVVGPGLLVAAGVPAPLIPVVLHLVKDVETLGLPGTSKKSKVMTGLDAAVTVANAARPDTFDVPAITDAASRGIDDIIAAVKAVHVSRSAPSA